MIMHRAALFMWVYESVFTEAYLIAFKYNTRHTVAFRVSFLNCAVKLWEIIRRTPACRVVLFDLHTMWQQLWLIRWTNNYPGICVTLQQKSKNIDVSSSFLVQIRQIFRCLDALFVSEIPKLPPANGNARSFISSPCYCWHCWHRKAQIVSLKFHSRFVCNINYAAIILTDSMPK